ncbi:MAG: hypothetical protein KF689_11785 [Gemmatimonadaceae bacterium]|nr:hypothetical protein [Gemmatimonadaceae bacterium]MCW5827341.1 hypothetical protein [Gemmatimonadaceae bacterium]
MHRRWAALLASTVALAACYERYTIYSTPSTADSFIAGGLPCHPAAQPLYAGDAFIWLAISPTRLEQSDDAADYSLVIGLAAPDSTPRTIHVERAVLTRPQVSGDSVLFRLDTPLRASTRPNPVPDARSQGTCVTDATVAYASVVLDSTISLPTAAGEVLRLEVALTVSHPNGSVRQTHRVEFRSSRRRVLRTIV